MSSTVVLLPGTLCTPDLWAHQRRELEGLVATTDVSLQASTIDQMVDAVLAAAPPPGPLILVGCSLGGIVALATHRRAPERIAGLALIATTARPPRPDQPRLWAELASQSVSDFDGLVGRLLPSLLTARDDDPLALAIVRSMANKIGPATYTRQLEAQATRVDERPGLTSCQSPVLVVAGAQDTTCTLDLHHEMAAIAPFSELELIPHCGHLAPLDQPEAVTDRLIPWVARLVERHATRPTTRPTTRDNSEYAQNEEIL